MADQHSFDTLKVRAGYDPAEHNYSTSVPIYQTTSFNIGSVERADRLIHFEELGGIVGTGGIVGIRLRMYWSAESAHSMALPGPWLSHRAWLP